MTKPFVQHIGDDQLVYGMPKHMSASASLATAEAASHTDKATYWRYHPKPQACEKCQALEGVWFKENPGSIHPNCKCEIEEFTTMKVNDQDNIIVPPGVDLSANIAEARRKAKECEKEAKRRLTGAEEDWRYKPALHMLTFKLKCVWIYENFKSHAQYDFKYHFGKRYEAFGNYHYGLYTKAMGIGVNIAQAAAGYYQIKQKTSPWSLESIPAWLDDPKDNAAIKKGQKYPLN